MEYKEFGYAIKIDNSGDDIFISVKILDDSIDFKNLQEELLDFLTNSDKLLQEFFYEDDIVELVGLIDDKNRSIIEYILKFGRFINGVFLLHGVYARDFLNILVGYDKIYFLDNEKKKYNIISKFQDIELFIEYKNEGLYIKPDDLKNPILLNFDGEKWYHYGNTIGMLLSVYSKGIWDKILTKGAFFKDDDFFNFVDNYYNYWSRYAQFKWIGDINNIKVLNNKLKIELSLDYEDGIIKAKPLYFYGKIAFTYNDIVKKGPYIVKVLDNELYCIKREPKKERRLFLFFFQYNFRWAGEYFVLDNEKDKIEFLTTGYKKIPKEWARRLSAKFRQIRLLSVKVKPVFNIELSENGDQFSMQMDTVVHLDENHVDPKLLKKEILEKHEYINISDTKILHIINLEEIFEIFKAMEEGFKFDYSSDTKYKNKIYFLPHLIHSIKRYEDVEIRGNEKFMRMYEEMMNVKGIKKVPLPEEMKDILREYQKEGYYWLRFLHRYRLSGILADDMGLGKTLQALALIRSIDAKEPSLVVCPKSLMHNWRKEIKKFSPNARVLVVEGNRQAREKIIEKYNEYDIFITSYSLLRNDIDIYEKKVYYFTILDEAQHIKNYKTKVAKSVKKVNSHYRFVLTGTPMENSIVELWSIFDFIMPGYLGSRKSFIEYYEKEIIREKNERVLNELNLKIKPFILRRTKMEVLTELPPKIEQVNLVPLSDEQMSLYRNVLTEVRSELFGIVKEKGLVKSKMHILSALVKLRQICNHPGLIYPELIKKENISSKMDLLLEILMESIDGGHRILLFSQFVKMLHIIRDYLRNLDIPFEYIDGKTADRLSVVERFNENEDIPILLSSLKAGGTGLNITGADVVIHFDPWWNPMVEAQATDRAYRMGQTKSVNVYKFITEGTIEEKILQMQNDKRHIFEALDFTDSQFMKNISWDDLKVLFE